MSESRLNIVEAFGGSDPRAGVACSGQSLEAGAERSAGPIRGGGTGRKAYSPPRLTRLAQIDELIDALGPAQAGYGGAGLVP